MIDSLMEEYVGCALKASAMDLSDRKSVRQFNSLSDRMRNIVDEVVGMGCDAVLQFLPILDKEPASRWAAHHLVEKADLDSTTLSRCFARVERAKNEAESEARMADAMGEEMWLKEWRARKA